MSRQRRYRSVRALTQGTEADWQQCITECTEAHTRRLACIYTALDGAQLVIAAPHLQAALALWDYALASAPYIFGARLGDPTADAILHALRATPDGLTREAIIHLLQRNKPTAELARVLGTLQELGLVRVEFERTGGRPAERWYALVSGTE